MTCFAVTRWRYFFTTTGKGTVCVVWCNCRIYRVHCDVIWAMFVYMFMFVLRVARGWCQYHWVDDARPHIRRPEQTYGPRPTRVRMRVYIRTGVILTTTRYLTQLDCLRKQFSCLSILNWLVLLVARLVCLSCQCMSNHKYHVIITEATDLLPTYCLLIKSLHAGTMTPMNIMTGWRTTRKTMQSIILFT